MNTDAVKYRTADLGQVKMFYREAGDATAPVVLLLHGFPTSSHMSVSYTHLTLPTIYSV